MKNMRCVKKKGFTLVEILLVLAIISVIVLLGVSSYSIVRKKVRLDIAANSVESIITEARERTRSGYYESDGDAEEIKSLCFGFRVSPGEFINFLQTPYNRLEQDIKCSRNTQNIKELRIGDIDEDIVIKEIEMFGSNINDEAIIFFRPPDAETETVKKGMDRDPLLNMVIGFENSDHPSDKREVVFNALTGNVYTQKYNEEE